MENTSEKTQITTENSDPKKEKKRLKALKPLQKLKALKPSQKIMLIAAVFVLAAAIVLTSVLIVRSNKKKHAAVIGETQTEAAVTDAELEVFGEDESVSSEEETTSAILFEIDEKMKNVQVATGDSKKDEDAEINRDYGTNSSRLAPAKSPRLNGRLTGVPLSSDSMYTSSLLPLKYVNRDFMSGLIDIDGTLFNFDSSHNPIRGHKAISDVQYYFNDNGALSSMVGIDVSHHNGKIDWAAVRAAGVDFAIIRVGFRGYGDKGTLKLDSRFNENVEGALNNGIQVGVYFYSQAVTVYEAVEEASVAVNYSRKYNITLPIYFDTEFSNSEHSGRADRLTASQRTNIAVAFCEAVKNAGYKPGIYASKTFYTDELNFSRLSNYEIWVAHYTSETTDFKYDYKVWQYTPKGRVNGIPNDTDINIALFDYGNNDDMSDRGGSVAFFDSDTDIQNALNAENSIKKYQLFRTQTLYNSAQSDIDFVNQPEVKAKLFDALENLKNKLGFLAEPTKNSENDETNGEQSEE